MRGRYADPNRQFTDGQVADAVHAQRVDDVVFRAGFFEDLGAFAFGQCRIRFVAQPVHAAAVVLVADPAFETGVAADAVVEQARAQRGDVERGIGELET